jgi:hypothetical protein
MIVRLALRSLLARPVRSAVRVGGFGLGVAVMAVLLGVGRVILDQARAPQLRGGGDVVIAGASGRLPNAPFVLSSVLQRGALASEIRIAAPSADSELFLVQPGGGTMPLRARGGVPSLERALGDPETSGQAAWTDTAADRAWAAPDPNGVLRAMDRFHAVPDVPVRAASWAEWLYFNGRTADARFYLTFMAGPLAASGRRTLGVRLQLERGGVMTTYADRVDIDEAALLAAAPDLAVGPNRVHLDGDRYVIALDLPAESGGPRATGELVLQAMPGRSVPPIVIRGAGGWMSGYVVPVMAGALHGALHVGADEVNFEDGAGYHDHNWGFWDGVSWQWGQVQHGDLSIVYGRVHPPADAADASRVPGFVVALGPSGPLGYASDVTIEETRRPDSAYPQRIVVRGRSASLRVDMDLTVRQTTATEMQASGIGRQVSGIRRQASAGGALTFFQLRADYRVTGRAGDTPLDFSALGSAETFEKGQAPGIRR